tara:strand:- start:3703 stop:3903 length:201 start_codon:yes stop_codon:yes gene_type:complete
MSKSPKRRAHVRYYQQKGADKVTVKDNDNEPPLCMTLLCAAGFLMAFVLWAMYFFTPLLGCFVKWG